MAVTISAGDANCTSGLSKRIFDAWLADARSGYGSPNPDGSVGPMTAAQANIVRALAWGVAQGVDAQLETDLSNVTTDDTPNVGAGNGLAYDVGTPTLLHVGAGNGIAVDADAVRVRLAAGGGLEFSGGDIRVVPGTYQAAGNYQAADADLTAIAALAGTSGLLRKTAANTWSLDTASYQPAGSYAAAVHTHAWADITSGKPTTLSGYGITDAQPLDADLTAIAALTGTTGLLRKTAANTWALDTASYQPAGAYELSTNKNVANGYAGLDTGGKISAAQLPAIAITDTFVVASQAAMLALTAEVGDVAVRTDLSKSFILKTAGASVLANWQELLTPSDVVSSVNGMTGAVTVSTITGNAGTATKLQTARTLALSGDVTGSGTFDGSANLTLTATVADDSHLHDTRYLQLTGGAVNGDVTLGGDLHFALGSGKGIQWADGTWQYTAPSALTENGAAILGDHFFDMLVSGFTVSGSGLNVNIAAGRAYVGGLRLQVAAQTVQAQTPSAGVDRYRHTFVDLTAAGTYVTSGVDVIRPPGGSNSYQDVVPPVAAGNLRIGYAETNNVSSGYTWTPYLHARDLKARVPISFGSPDAPFAPENRARAFKVWTPLQGQPDFFGNIPGTISLGTEVISGSIVRSLWNLGSTSDELRIGSGVNRGLTVTDNGSMVLKGTGYSQGLALRPNGGTGAGAFFGYADSQALQISNNLGGISLISSAFRQAVRIGDTFPLSVEGTVPGLLFNVIDNSGWKHFSTGPAAVLEMDTSDGGLIYYNAPSNTAGASAAFTQRVKVTNDGRIASSWDVSCGAYGHRPSVGTGIDTWSTLFYNNEEWDTHNAQQYYDGTVGRSWRFTAPIFGRYFISAIASFGAGAGTTLGDLYLAIWTNGTNWHTTLDRRRIPYDQFVTLSGSAVITLQPGDFIEIRAYSQGASRPYAGNANEARVNVFRLPGA